MKELLKKCKGSPVAIALFGVLLIYFVYICIINLSLTPSFYCTDMYSDVLYAVRAWETKSIFPDGWVFGNQFYVIATPVLASLLYGVIGHPAMAMAIASILMTVGVILSFLWMLKSVFPRIEERLIGVLGFIVLTSLAGNVVVGINGWQLFFTMCSYYACYIITAFICFGVFLRRREELTGPRIAMLVIAIILSFCTGMQSLRQTVIMLPAMLAIEGIEQFAYLKKFKRLEKQPLIITMAISVANLIGLGVVRFLNIPQNEYFSYTGFLSIRELPASIVECLMNMAKLLTGKQHFITILLVVAITAVSVIRLLLKKEDSRCSTLVALFIISVLCFGIVDVFTNMTVRSIYYFMLFPLVSISLSYVFRYWKLGKGIVLALLAVLVIISFKTSILPVVNTALEADSDISYEISDMMIEKGYTTIYSGWNQCEDIAIVSGGKITAGFWNVYDDVFNPVMYLCDPVVYEEESSKCVYYLKKDNRDIALEQAQKKGVTMTLVVEYPEEEIWLYEASENLMQMSLK